MLLGRSSKIILQYINSQKGGFQDGLGSIMTSFLLKESSLYSKELHSQVYDCYLDARQAFDRVRHDDLLYTLNACDKDYNFIFHL